MKLHIFRHEAPDGLFDLLEPVSDELLGRFKLIYETNLPFGPDQDRLALKYIVRTFGFKDDFNARARDYREAGHEPIKPGDLLTYNGRYYRVGPWDVLKVDFDDHFPRCARCLGKGCERCGQTGHEDDLNPDWKEG